jgi:hypothetical protein
MSAVLGRSVAESSSETVVSTSVSIASSAEDSMAVTDRNSSDRAMAIASISSTVETKCVCVVVAHSLSSLQIS